MIPMLLAWVHPLKLSLAEIHDNFLWVVAPLAVVSCCRFDLGRVLVGRPECGVQDVVVQVVEHRVFETNRAQLLETFPDFVTSCCRSILIMFYTRARYLTSLCSS